MVGYTSLPPTPNSGYEYFLPILSPAFAVMCPCDGNLSDWNPMHFILFKNLQATDMLKVLAAKSNNLSSIPLTNTVEEENGLLHVVF